MRLFCNLFWICVPNQTLGARQTYKPFAAQTPDQRQANLLRKLRQTLLDTRTCVVFTRSCEDAEERLDQTLALGADWHTLAHCAATRLRLAASDDGARCTVVKCKLAPAYEEVLLELPAL